MSNKINQILITNTTELFWSLLTSPVLESTSSEAFIVYKSTLWSNSRPQDSHIESRWVTMTTELISQHILQMPFLRTMQIPTPQRSPTPLKDWPTIHLHHHYPGGCGPPTVWVPYGKRILFTVMLVTKF